MKQAIILLSVAFALIGCDRNRVGDEKGYTEREATDLSTIKTGTSDNDTKKAKPGSATGPGGETSGGTFGTSQDQPGTSGNTNLVQPAPQK